MTWSTRALCVGPSAEGLLHARAVSSLAARGADPLDQPGRAAHSSIFQLNVSTFFVIETL